MLCMVELLCHSFQVKQVEKHNDYKIRCLPEDSAQAELADLPAGTREEVFIPLCLCAAGWDEPLQDQAPWGLVRTTMTARELELRGYEWVEDPLNLAEWLGLEGRVREVILHNLLGKYVRVVVRDPR